MVGVHGTRKRILLCLPYFKFQSFEHESYCILPPVYLFAKLVLITVSTPIVTKWRGIVCLQGTERFLEENSLFSSCFSWRTVSFLLIFHIQIVQIRELLHSPADSHGYKIGCLTISRPIATRWREAVELVLRPDS